MNGAERRRIRLSGVVQGVGFRPFAHGLAARLGLAGWARNSGGDLLVEVEGDGAAVREFERRLILDRPPHAVIDQALGESTAVLGEAAFHIRGSEGGGPGGGALLPDLAICAACRAEILDPKDRRSRHPFANCTQCGPRFSIVERVPYDRANTTMVGFEMCANCRAEYVDPANRRFHAQPIACPQCGPQLEFCDATGVRSARRDSALARAAEAIRGGGIIAVKGLGGFHLIADARNEKSVARLRARKARATKPLAVMAPSVHAAREWCELTPLEERLLTGPQTPIALARKRVAMSDPTVAPSVAPNNPFLGVMLPYTPLHCLLLNDLGFPVVATSGNRAEEPICIGNEEAVRDLAGIADGFLMHDRPIRRAVDDSVIRVMVGEPMILRRSRGYAPLPIRLPRPCVPTMAHGADLKNTIALARGREVFISQHVGDLATEKSLTAHECALADFPALLGVDAERRACDAHPDYHSSRGAVRLEAGAMRVQHHHAHAVACLAEHGLEGPALAVVWDGTGHGLDGTVWGGEFLRATLTERQRVGHFLTFPLPGGERAIREPRWAAFGVLRRAGIPLADLPLASAFSESDIRIGDELIEKGVNCPLTSSAGRLLDAVSALLGLRLKNDFEGDAAMQLEFAAGAAETNAVYPIEFNAGKAIDWRPALRDLAADLRAGREIPFIAAKFHNTMVETVVLAARVIGLEHVALSGGCFQNQRLLEGAVMRLRRAGFRPIWPKLVPPNDGGIALGQAVIAGLAATR